MASSKVKTTTTEKGSTVADLSKSQIKQMQTALKKAGYDVGSTGADGVWGEKTAAAVSAWKKDTGNSNTAGNTIGVSNYNKLIGKTSSSKKSSSSSASGTTPTTTYTDADLQNAYTKGYDAASASIEDTVNAALTPYQEMYANMTNNQTAALEKAQTLSAEQVNRAYDDAARNYYQLYKTQQAQLPENLSKAGVTGGASESAQLNLLNNYANNLYKNESARNNQLAGVNQDYNDKIAENSVNAASAMASAYLQVAQQQLQYKREDEQAAAAEQKTAEEEAEAKKVEAWNANVRTRMAEQLKKGDTIWTWTDDDGRVHWSTYQAVGVANGGKKLSASNYASLSSSGDGGGGGDAGTIYHTYKQTTTGTANLTYADVEKQAGALRYGNSTYGQKTASSGAVEDVTEYLKQMYNNGVITEKQAKKLLKKYAVADSTEVVKIKGAS